MHTPRWILAATALLGLVSPLVAEASYTSTVVGTTATMIGDGSSDTLTITDAGGFFSHNRFGIELGFNSSIDFDTSAAGDQTIPSATGTINIDAGDGTDVIAIGTGVNLRGTVDGGPGLDMLAYIPSADSITANLGLNTTGLSAALGSDQENPVTTHPGTGTATVSNYNIATHTFDITVTVTDLAPATVTGFHIHRGTVGVNGPIIVDFGTGSLVPAGTGFTFNASGLVLPSVNEAAFIGGGTYVNVHTATFPGGAIRGQLFSNGNVNLSTGAATGTASIANIENLAGGTGDDSLVGSFVANNIDGGPGVDWLVGGPGADTLTGGVAADVLVWSNGDGSDLVEGGPDADIVQVNGNVTTADVFVVSANGTRIDFDRTGAGAFSLDIGTAETLTVNGIGGNDTLTVNDMTGVASLSALNLNGFEGNEDFVFSAPAAGPVTISANGGNGASDTLSGPNAGATWNITAANQGDIAGLVSFRLVEALVGRTGSDIFNAKAFATGTPTVAGGDGTDILYYDAEMRVVTGDRTPPDGAIVSPGVQTLTFTSMESVILANASNTDPTISTIADQTIPANSSTAAIAFTVGDLETAPASLTLSGTSSNPTLVPNTNITFGGSGAARTVTVTPAINQIGTATITVTVSDGTLTAPSAFLLTVTAPTTVQAPTELYISAMSGNVITFRFKPPVLGPPPTGFSLEGGVTPSQVLASLPTGSTTPIFTVAAPTGSFFVRMHSTRGTEKSAASNEIPVQINVPVPPSVPDMFRSAVNGDSVVLGWRNTFGGGQPTSLILDVSGSVSAQIPLEVSETLSVNSVPAGTYTLRMRAVNAGGVSSASSPVLLTIPASCPGPPEAPSSFLAYRIGSTANVVWEPPASGPAVANYVVTVTGGAVGTIQTTLRALAGQAPPGSYTLTVAAVNACGSSPPTPPQTIVIP